MKQTYWKDIRRAFGKSKGRFLSIMLLMMLGSFALDRTRHAVHSEQLSQKTQHHGPSGHVRLWFIER